MQKMPRTWPATLTRICIINFIFILNNIEYNIERVAGIEPASLAWKARGYSRRLAYLMLLLTTNFSYIKKKNPSFVERTETALTDKRQISFLSCTELRALFLYIYVWCYMFDCGLIIGLTTKSWNSNFSGWLTGSIMKTLIFILDGSSDVACPYNCHLLQL